MEVEDLKRIIEGGERVEVEFKQSFHSIQDIAKIICAFSNTQGGILLLGVKANGEIEGMSEDLDKTQQKISQSNLMVQPTPIIDIEIHTLEARKIILVIVHKADASVFHSVGGVIYIRLGSTVQKLEGQSIVEFLRNRQILLFEESIEFSARIGDLEESRVKEYLETRKQPDYLKTHSLNDFLLSKKLASFQPDIKLKNIALLFFAKDLQSFFHYIQIKLVRFDGVEPIKVLAYEESKGNLPQMIEHALNFVRRFIPREFIIDEIKRKEIPILPEEAVREAIINAVAHRDYFNKNEIQLSIFDDRFELTNPGGLPEGMTKELLGALSIQRNPFIYQFLKDYGYMEGIGSGISKIYKSMKDANLNIPDFVLTKELFRIVLKMKKVTIFDKLKDILNTRQINALSIIKTNKKIKTKEYASINKVSITTALKDLKELEEKGFLRKVGLYKSAYYVLIEDQL